MLDYANFEAKIFISFVHNYLKYDLYNASKFNKDDHQFLSDGQTKHAETYLLTLFSCLVLSIFSPNFSPTFSLIFYFSADFHCYFNFGCEGGGKNLKNRHARSRCN